jgi:hypothetical protein
MQILRYISARGNNHTYETVLEKKKNRENIFIFLLKMKKLNKKGYFCG